MSIYIKILKKKLYIHPMIVLVFCAAIFFHGIKELLIVYGIALIHELFHLIAAYYLHIEIEGITILPFGVALRIKNSPISKPVHEIIIGFAGPFSNILMIFIAYLIKVYYLFETDDMTFFIFTNIAIGAMNLLPILPLDGGRILKALLTSHWGFIKAFNFTIRMTKLISVVILVLGVYVLYVTRFNLSLVLISFFLISNVILERQNNNLVIMKEIIYSKEKLSNRGIYKAKNIVVISDMDARKLLNEFSYNQFYLVTVIDSQMHIIGTVTETQIIEGLVRLGTQASVKDIFESVENIK